MNRRILPIYTTVGDVGGFLYYPYIFSPTGEWIGWVTEDREVYSTLGMYVGWLSDDPRVLRKRSYDFSQPRREPPSPPPKLRVPARVPLAPLMPELTQTIIDVLYEEPYRLTTADYDELREDMR
ncbi:MAG: hypothetical protein GWN61_11280 [candidate division Zixibacteria bacterium]|nr:hypothetical protein [candidate division Zixibacteria bacterium]NIT71954.1 hypothetical protein [candidate division KSB1 bacterium]NIW45604.1 hypothetical protein [Gammaproteobacteria bacterium]NIR64783.1 hypothetical protein [candidate division Zixibacteria bacterium]NIS46611.1 hypothetical protein [candidate division Zixibacteria bacterium]